MAKGSRCVRLGLIGCGRVAEERHLPALRNLPDVQVVAAADINANRLEHVAGRFRIENRYSDYRALLDHSGIEAVCICVPPRFHAEVAFAALDAGKHLFIEKPVALSLDECDRLIQRAAHSVGKVMVGFNMRWHRLVRQARQIVLQGSLGPVKAMRSVFTHFRSPEASPDWTRWRQLGGGVLINEAVHHFDLWRFLLHSEVEEVFAISQSERCDDETATLSARLANGVLATGLFSLSASQDNQLEIYGQTGTLHVSCYRFDGLEYLPVSSYPGDVRTRLRRVAHSLKEVPPAARGMLQGGDFVASFGAEWGHFLDSIRQDAHPDCTLEDGRRALQVALAAVESASKGRPAEVGEASRQITPVSSDTLAQGKQK